MVRWETGRPPLKEGSNPIYSASAWVNIVSQSKRRARGGFDGLSGIFLVPDWARLFRGHITSEAFVERRTKTRGKANAVDPCPVLRES